MSKVGVGVGLGSGLVDVGEVPSSGGERWECWTNALESSDALMTVSSGHSLPLCPRAVLVLMNQSGC